MGLSRWENEYDVASLDMDRHASLCSILRNTNSLEVRQGFCRYFHLEHTQPYKKNLVLDVLSNVARWGEGKDLFLEIWLSALKLVKLGFGMPNTLF